MNPTPPVPYDEQTTVVERPDGFYWQDELTGALYGPFDTRQEAEQDIQEQADTGYEEGESLEEAEAEIGIASLIDPETGELAEDLQPHLSDEGSRYR